MDSLALKIQKIATPLYDVYFNGGYPKNKKELQKLVNNSWIDGFRAGITTASKVAEKAETQNHNEAVHKILIAAGQSFDAIAHAITAVVEK
jgi:hypothetical protein